METLGALSEPIAIVGSACRFPGSASNPSKLWDLLREPCDVGGEIPEDRFRVDGFYHPNSERHGTSNVKRGYFLTEDFRHFDTGFFNSNPREAEVLDPQQRILLETTYEAIEAAGYSLERIQGSKTAVYVGLMSGDSYETHLRDPDTIPQHLASGNARSILSNRISYFFDWKGPSMTIDTACSSSLVALHHAVQSLRIGEVETAVAAGANLMLGPEVFIAESKLHMLSPTGRSQMWDADADGYARGEGTAVLMLKTLSKALRDGDHIESIVRETGVNSDGRTKGITMPSATSQAALIRETYRRAGLDCLKDRCQYFEAHGTGTQAGDPIEASAVQSAFFESCSPPRIHLDEDRLWVGSIKTIIGHLEGAAGIAGVIKASLAVQNRLIPPNLFFNKLNPSVEPFYNHLEIPTNVQQWPPVPQGEPLRASVNSFGFGGTNAHAIVESFDAECQTYHLSRLGGAPSPAILSSRDPPIGQDSGYASTAVDVVAEDISLELVKITEDYVVQRTSSNKDSAKEYIGPLLVSANSERSLVGSIEALVGYLKANDNVNLLDLGWTLQSRRTTLPIKAHYSGLTQEKLIEQMEVHARVVSETSGRTLGTVSRSSNAESATSMLGIFTGQGAQWPSMGRELIKRSHIFKQSIDALEESLAGLCDPPLWSIRAELSASASSSRVDIAEICQPVCTAVQIALLDLLDCAGIRFGTVVGHSSGEIACAYAAGHLSASDAIRIAYYRGKFAKLAQGPTAQVGSMMAVGLSYDDALDFCDQPRFKSRIVVAASNAAGSVTISGDADAILDAKLVLDEKQMFARLLNVDTAYHSHHMHPCSRPYIEALRACDIGLQKPKPHCVWISSVYGFHGEPDPESLRDVYWEQNMTKPVLFSQALERALYQQGPFDVALEVGPHPALKGPATQVIKHVEGNPIPYQGLLSRRENDVEAFSNALGFMWAHLGPSMVDFQGYKRAYGPKFTKGKLLKGLPTYCWDHGQSFWRESRLSKRYRHRGKPHELLGSRCQDDSDCEMRWRNIIRIEEIPWLRGHRLQGQIVMPAASYCVMALEASIEMSKGQSISLIELRDVAIYRAIALDEGSAGAELIFSLKRWDDSMETDGEGRNILAADFMCESCPVDSNSSMNKIFSGQLRVTLGESHVSVLPSRDASRLPPKNPINVDGFYEALSRIGLNYAELFRGITSASRTMGSATAVVPKPPPSEEGGYSVVHPAHLDIAFQATFAALTAPDNGSMWSAFVPTTIERLLINPALCLGKAATGESLMDTSIIDQVRPLGTKAATISADIGIYNYDTGEMEIQVDNLLLTALSRSSASDDRQFFSNTVWDMDIASGIAIISEEDPLVDCQVIDLGERVSYYYLRNLVLSVPKEDRNVLEWHHQRLLEFGEDIISRVDSGDHPTVKKDWADDTHEEILNKISKFPGKVDLEIMKAVGENIHSAVLGKTAILEHMMADSMLDRLYKTSVGQARINNYLGKMAKQIAHRYPRMNILEVGGGTGGATKSVLEALNGAFNSYLFTDISPGFFENAQAQFRDYGSKMNYKVLDVEKDVAAQGLREHSYDVIVASNVLHATRNLENTMRNVRRLLKPGGYLLLLEATGELLRVRFVMGGLPGWWLGHEDGRTHGPVISISSWHTLLMKTGFSGVDHSVNDFNDPLRYLCSAMVSQAVNDEVQMIRQPFAFSQNIPLADGLLVIGGKTAKTSKLATEMCSLLSFWKDKIVVIPSLMDENLHLLSSTTTVLNLEELDEPVFQSITAAKFKTLQALSVAAKRVLWITHDTRDNNPYGNMMVGLGRSILSESPHLQLQFLSLEGSQVVEPDARALSVNLLRMLLADMPALSDGSILWTAEPELVLNNTKLLIPRIKSLGEMDDRLNSSRRFITKAVNPNLFPVEKIWTGSSYGLREQNFIHGEEDCLKLHITQSTVEAIRVGIGNYLFLCLGTDFETGAEVITLSKSNASLIEAPPTLIQEYNEQPYGSLRSVALSLYAQALVARLPEKGNLLHELDLDLATAVYDLANEQQKEVFFTMSKSIGAMCSLPWTFIHAQSSPRSIKSILPQDIKYFVDASGGGLGSLSSRVAQCLPLTCEKEIIRAFSSPTSRLGHYSSLRDIEYALARACRHSLSLRSQNEGDLLGGMIPVTESINNPVTTVPSTIMNWPSATSLSVPPNWSRWRAWSISVPLDGRKRRQIYCSCPSISRPR